jgi:predicted phosphodiesterase
MTAPGTGRATRIAVCGGPYGNPYALRAFVTDARARGAQRLYCLGDLGGFGAEVDALWPILTDAGITCVAGNYDVAIARADPDCGCGYRDPRDNAFAQLIYDHTLATTSRTFAGWMGGLPTDRRETLGGCDLHFVHGSPLAVNDFWWASLPEYEHRARVAASAADVVCCTHSGLPWQRRVDGTLVVNVGVLGKPANDGRQNVWYALLDLDRGQASAELVPLVYDWAAQATSMRAAGLPEPFVETIETGWWTTCLEVLPPAERAAGRYHLYRSLPPAGFTPAAGGWSDVASDGTDPDDARPARPLFGSAYFPPRLWIYTNFHCNLACDYCAVASSPRADPRSLPLERFTGLVDEALAEGFTEIYLTGGEPLLHPDLAAMLRYAADRVPTVLLTNAMLLRGRRLTALAGLAGHPRLRVQTSLDGARPRTHDAHRGAGAFVRTVDGIGRLVELGLPPRVALTETPDNTGEVPAVAGLLTRLGVPADRLAVRPLLHRGLSEHGIDIAAETTVPELTVTVDGLHWHPAGADATTSPDMLLCGPQASLADGKRAVTERFFTARLADGSLPRPYRCAI